MVQYQQDKCNIHNCTNPIYKDNMCQEHYEFYAQNPLVNHVIEEKTALDTGKASVKVRMKKHLHSFIHHSLDLPMPLYEHFPLEHVFLAELNSARSNQKEDVEHYEKVIKDFDIPENENIAAMKRILNFKDIETSELGPKGDYLLEKKHLPSMAPPVLAVIGFALLFCLFEWILNDDFQIRGYGFDYLKSFYLQYIPYLYTFTIMLVFGLMIPSLFNHFVERCYNLTMYKGIEDNVKLVNQIRYVKDRKERAGSYYATIQGSTLGSITCIFVGLLSGGTVFSWQSVLLCVAVSLSITPLVYSLAEMSLYYPVIEATKRKRVEIDLYNADHCGGLKHYHRYLYLVLLYSEGIVTVLGGLIIVLPISNAWLVLLFVLLWNRFNHAGWAILNWIRTIIDFHARKAEEKDRLMIDAGSLENIARMNWLKRTHATGVIPVALGVLSIVLIPYLVAQIPDLFKILELIGVMKP